MMHFYPKKKTSSTLCYVLLVVVFAFTQFSEAQTSFTESASLYNLDIAGDKDGGHAWADYDKDGDLDLLVNRLNTNSVLLRNQFIETGTASFIDMTAALTDGMNTNRERSAIFADFNNDSYPDFARNTSFEGIEIRLQHPGTHVFGDGLGGTAPYIFNTTNVSDGVNTEGMVAFDFDQDGDLDIAFDNHDYGIDLLINDGSGIFTHGTPKGVNYDINDSTTWPFGLAQDAIDGDYSSGTDFDNDGFVDIVSRKNGQVDFFRNIGAQFSTTSIDIDDSDNNSKGGIGFYDFDNDGDFDLFWTENGANQIHENQNGVYVALGASTGIPTLFPGDKIEGMACGDIDNDGDMDIFLAGDDGYLFVNQLNSAAGPNTGSPMTFVQDTANTFLAGSGNGEGCTFVDFDRDGDLDLYTNISDSANHLYINNLSNANSDKYLFVDIIENRDVFNLTGIEQRYAVGATARLVDCDGNVISGIREVNGGNGHGTQDPQRIHFGIPFDADIEIIVEVFFPVALGERIIIRMPFVPNTLGTGWERSAVITPDQATPNNAPNLVDDAYNLDYDPNPVSLTPLVNDSDIDDDPLQILSITQPDHGTAVLNPDGTISYTPEPGYLGNVVLTYLVEDLPSCRIFSMSDTATINILITEDTPIISTMYEEEITILCGEAIPEIPELEFMGGCESYTVEFEEETLFVDNASDYMVVRTWTVTDICNRVQIFQQIIFIMQHDQANISLEICTLDGAVDLKDSLPVAFDTNGTFSVVSGDATITNEGIFDATDLELGDYVVAYEATTSTCTYNAEFIITVHNDCVPIECNPEDLTISKTITVNGDGVNDFLEIKGLESCNFIYKIKVFNRWGKVVYASDDYQNSWGAFSPNNSVGDSGTLPTGTYYYILNFSDSSVKPINGYIYIGTK